MEKKKHKWRWYCVMRISHCFEELYIGRDEAEARRLNVPGTVFTDGATRGTSERDAVAAILKLLGPESK